MQLINIRNKNKVSKKNLKALLTTATCTLLSASPNMQAQSVADEDEWKFDTAIMFYNETDRVSAAEGIIAGTKTFADDQVLSLKLTVDALTGASATGAVAQPNVQTFTRPSGKGEYTVEAGEIPLDDTFKDTRVQLTGQWTQPIAEEYSLSVGGNLSKEYDYLSLGMNANLAKDFNQKNTTVSVGLALAQDMIEPEGGIPKPLNTSFTGVKADNESAFDDTRLVSDDDKTTVDLLFGVTQVINKRMISQFNYSYSKVDGYMTDPFKVVSIVNNNGVTQQNIYESRPDTRSKHAFFAQTKVHFDSLVLDTSYRYMTDDWDIDSHTIDSRFRIALAGDYYIEPHIRFYQQSAAEFYSTFLVSGDVIPEFTSADYRIGELSSYTLGVKFGVPLSNGTNLAFRLEYYKQTPKNNGFEAIGVLSELDLYKELDALVLQVSYSF